MENTRREGRETLRLISQTRELYFAGICGISMAGLAHMAQARGWRVRGCDRAAAGAQARALLRAGIPVEAEDSPSPKGAGAMIYTTAVGKDSPAIRYARDNDIPLISRADLLAALMADFPTRIVVAGMHGKSTTVGMLAAILTEAGVSPTVSGGAPLTPGGDAYRIGEENVFLAEGCEYRDAFLSLSPTLAVVTNIDHDHPDYFPDLGAVKSSFLRFLLSSPSCVLGGDCQALSDIAPAGAVQFGYSSDCTLRGQDTAAGLAITHRGTELGTLTLAVTGRYNRENALAATAAALELGIPFPAIRNALHDFSGVGRRMEYQGLFQGARVFLDYAHHPTEISAALGGIDAEGGRILCIYQPHTFTRTAALWEGFVSALGQADKTLLLDIYPAREKPLPGITSARLAAAAGADYAPDFPAAVAWAKENAKPQDTLLIMGAGDICQLADALAPKMPPRCT